MANAAQVLQQAHDLIEAGDYQAARQILDAVRSSNENNPDFWWVYAHAVDDATEGKAAIERVRQLAPNYAGLETLIGGSPQASGIKPLRPLSPPPPPIGKLVEAEVDEFDELDDLDDLEDLEDTEEEEKQPKPNRLMPILALIFLVLLIGAVLFISLSGVFNNNGTLTPEPTGIVDNFTQVVPTSESQVVITEEPSEDELAFQATGTAIGLLNEITMTQLAASATAAVEAATASAESAATEEAAIPTEEVVVTEENAATEEVATEVVEELVPAEVMEDLVDFGVPEAGVTQEDSSLGQTLVVTTCATPGPVATQNIIGILNAFKAAGVELQVEALAFNITDCSDNSVILSLGISAEIVQSYWLGDTTGSELLAALRRL